MRCGLLNLKGKLVSLMLGALVAISSSGSSLTYADSLSSAKQHASQLQSEASHLDGQISSDKSQAQVLKTQVDNYTKSLANVESAIQSNNDQIQSLESQIHVLDQNIQSNTVKLNGLKTELAHHIQTMYEDGNVSYLAVLFQATSFSDLLSRIYALSLITQENKKIETQYAAMQTTLLNQKTTMDTDHKKLVQKQSSLEFLKSTDEQLQSQKHRALHLMNQKIHSETYKRGMLESQIRLTQSQISALEAQTQAAESRMQNSSYVAQAQSALVSANASSLIRYAEQFMGTPYVWGGTSPSGFDCSGFTLYVFSHFGISLGRTAADQFSSGVPVSGGQLQPGDLVFFSTYAPGATHVGIYIGNGLMVDSQDSGVAIDGIGNSYWGPKYIGARRYIK
jgi:peptidoglycan DL-endopeptidase CwlO